jgi:hypothetical protein
LSTHLFVKVFDLADSGFKDWEFAASGLIFVAVGLVFFFGPRLIAMTGIPFFDFQSRRVTFFRYGFLGFALIWTVIAFTGTFLPYWKHRAMVLDNACRVVEGTVDDFQPLSASGHGEESFVVAGVRFAYSDYRVSDGFNNASGLGGPIRGGQIVRICYDPADHTILRLEIRDYRGPVSRAVSFPQMPQEPAGNVPDMPWYASLFMYVYFIDWTGQFLMVRPYLRRFIRLGRPIAVHAPVSVNILHSPSKVKLAHTLLQPDRDANALWLRPRGFNILQVPMLVAKMNVDPVTAAITSYEIRLSAGIALTLGLLFFGAYALFAPELGRDTAALFLGGFAVVALVVNALHIRQLRAHMMQLVQDALPELATR